MNPTHPLRRLLGRFTYEPVDVPGAITVTAAKLMELFAAGHRFRLVCIRSQGNPARVDDQWPLVVYCTEFGDGQQPPVLIEVQCDPYIPHDDNPEAGESRSLGYAVRHRDKVDILIVDGVGDVTAANEVIRETDREASFNTW